MSFRPAAQMPEREETLPEEGLFLSSPLAVATGATNGHPVCNPRMLRPERSLSGFQRLPIFSSDRLSLGEPLSIVVTGVSDVGACGR